ncbi:hypothetical protein [Paraburkholderia caledonica]|uniref:hypothetical protein n=1 Tax=Paraburkholderia caledonica TaxID=134536 RepID=UPI000B3FF7E9|nr:hypothetical protein [Paraburkholderia caledonica]
MEKESLDPSAQEFAVYDLQTGEIIHRHRVFIFAGARVISREELENEALTHALRCRAALNTAECGVVTIRPEDISKGQHYKIDVAFKAVVGLDKPER